MKILTTSIACILLVGGSGCARRAMQREAAMRRQQEQQTQSAQGGERGYGARAARPSRGAQPSEGEVAEGITVKEGGHFGQYLVDDQGRALYLFTRDEGAQASTCTNDCAEAWPPALAEGRPQAQHPSIRDARLGTVRREDGSLQLTYNGWPLYYYARDREAGQVTGQEVESFGGEWYLLDPAGEKVEAQKKKATN